MESCARCGAAVQAGRCPLCGHFDPSLETPRREVPQALAATHTPDLAETPASQSGPRLSRAALVVVAALASAVGGGLLLATQLSAGPPLPQPNTSQSTNDTSPLSEPSSDAASVLTTLSSGSWITVIESLPKSEYQAGSAAKHAEAFSWAPEKVVVVDTDRVGGLNPGYWAVSVVGFSTRLDAREACSHLGLEVGPSCYPRLID